MAYNVTIGAVDPGTADAHFTTWRLFLESSAPGITPTDWVVTFQANEVHIAQRYNTDFNQGDWMTEATSVTVTSEGFTGIPYGTLGGNTSQLYFSFGDKNKLYFTSSTTCDFTFQDIELRVGPDNGANNSMFFQQSYAHTATFNRVIITDWRPGGNSNSNLFGIGYSNTGNGFAIYNSLITGCQFGTGSGRFVFGVQQSSQGAGNTKLYDVIGTTIAGNDDSEASNVLIFQAKNGIDASKLSAYNCVIGVENGASMDSDWLGGNLIQNVTQDGLGTTPNVNVYTVAGGTSEVYTDVDAGNFDMLPDPNPALRAALKLASTTTSPLTKTLRGFDRDLTRPFWDAGAMMGTAAPDPPVEVTCSIESYLESFGTPSVTPPPVEATADIEGVLRSTGAPTVIAPPPSIVSSTIRATLRTDGTPTATDPLPVEVTVDMESLLRTSGTPSMELPDSDFYSNASGLDYTNPYGVAYGPRGGTPITCVVLGTVTTLGTPTVAQPPAQELTGDITGTLSASGAPTVETPRQTVCGSAQSIGTARTLGEPSTATPIESITAAISATLRTQGTPAATVELTSNIESILVTKGLPTLALPPNQLISSIRGVLRSTGLPSDSGRPTVCGSAQSIGTMRNSGQPSIELPPDTLTAAVESTLRSSGSPSVTVPSGARSFVLGVARNQGEPTVVNPPAQLTASIEATLRTSGSGYINSGWTNPSSDRLFIVCEDLRSFIVPHDNRYFEVT